jgi:hypothetical protein
VGLQQLRREVEPGLGRGDQRTHDGRGVHLPQPHADKVADADTNPREHRLHPEPDRHDRGEDHQREQRRNEQYDGERRHGPPGVDGRVV